MDSTEHDGAAGAPAKAPARTRSTRNLALRGLSALVVLGVIYYCLWRDAVHASGWAWAILTALFSIPCLRELYRLASASGAFPFAWLGYVVAPLWILASEWDLSGGGTPMPGIGMAWLVFVFTVTAALLLQLTRKNNDTSLHDVSATIFGVIYCGVLPGISVHIRHLSLGDDGWPMHGIEFVVVTIFISKVSDVGALLTGSRWGRHKLIPRLSPGKTWEGAVGGLAFSVFLLQFMAAVEPRMALAGLGWAGMLGLSALLAAAGLGGDLIESSFKRNSRRKDAGTGVPGFGGILDLTDSLLVAAPVMYFFLVLCGAKYAPS